MTKKRDSQVSDAEASEPQQVMGKKGPPKRGRSNEAVANETIFQRLSAVEPIPMGWVWEDYLPQGKLALLVGEAGVGKSLVALQVAAMVTRGCQTPLELQQAATGSPGAVVLLTSADEGLADSVRPKLAAAGANLDHVYVYRADTPARSRGASGRASAAPDQSDHEPGGVDQLRRALHRIEANLDQLRDAEVELKLIVIDSLDRLVSSAKKRALCGIATQLVDLAERSGATVLVVTNAPSSPLAMAGASGDRWQLDMFANSARAVLMLVQDPDHRPRRLVLPVKLNFSGLRTGWAFRIVDGVVHWRAERTSLTAEAFFRRLKRRSQHPLLREEASQLRRAIRWLKESLSNGPVAAVWIQCDAASNDISYATLRRAYAWLGCRSVRKHGTTRWFWRLPGPAFVSLYSSPDVPGSKTQANPVEAGSSVESCVSADALSQVAHVSLDEQLD